MIKLLKHILGWIKNPDDTALSIGLGEKLRLLPQLVLLDILIAIPFGSLSYLIHHHILRLNASLINFDLASIIVFVVFVIPFFEELIFRFPLTYKRNYLARGIDYLVGDWFLHRWTKYFGVFVYTMSLFFGLVHLTNYENKELLFFCLGPFIVGSQLIGGLLLSYCRIKLGFIWSVMQHGIFNAFAIAVSLIFFHNAAIVDSSNDDYLLKVTELMYVDNTPTFYSTSTYNDVYHKIDAKNVSLQSVLDSLDISVVQPYDNIWVNYYFESKNGLNADELLDLMKKDIKFTSQDSQ